MDINTYSAHVYDYTLNSSHSGIKLSRYLYIHKQTTRLLYIVYCYYFTFFLLFFFLIQFYAPFKIISLIETSQLIGGAKREYPGKTT